MRILFLGNVNNPLLLNLAFGLKEQYGCSIDILSDKKPSGLSLKNPFTNISFIDSDSVLYRLPKIKMLSFSLTYRKELRAMPMDYDICHIHYLSANYSFSIKEIRKRSKKIVATVFGSEYYKSSFLIRLFQKKIIKSADAISFANRSTLNSFKKTFRINEKKLHICKYGLAIFDQIKLFQDIKKSEIKEKLGLSPGAFIITCGTNASPFQQHTEIINALSSIQNVLPQDYQLLFPLTYGGSPGYVEKLRSLLDQQGLKYKFYTQFLPEKDLSYIRLATDLLIQVQVTDQLSGAMQEHIFAGNVILTGRWLPYEEFYENGVVLETVEKVEDIDYKLVNIIRNFDFYKAKANDNPGKVYKMASVESTVTKWFEVYKEILK
jgi:hypothetical protein